MADYRFKLSPLPISETEAYAEASAEELRVIIAISDRAGSFTDTEIIEAARVSKARFSSALALWREAGVLLTSEGEGDNVIVSEFEERIFADEVFEESAEDMARSIRDYKLGELFSLCSEYLGRPELYPMEMKLVVALRTQYALSNEYIAVLASHLNDKEVFAVQRLVRRARALCEKGVDTVSELEDYLKRVEKDKTLNSQVKRAFGIWDRNLLKPEREFIARWSGEFGFDIAIITEAFDRLPTGNKLSFEYIDKILADWHSHGCRTVADCSERYEAWRAEQREGNVSRSTPAQKPARAAIGKKNTPRYGDFDPEDALRRALAKSFGNPAGDTDGADSADGQ